jgi:hypothetical protein
MQLPADINRKLLRLRSGKNHAMAQRMQKTCVADPALLFHQNAMHDRYVSSRTSETDPPQLEPEIQCLPERRCLFRRRSGKVLIVCRHLRHYNVIMSFMASIGKGAFQYERTSPDTGPLGRHSTTADCWLRLHGARLRQTVQRARSFRRHTAGHRRARASSHGMAYHPHRTHRGLAVLLGAFVSVASLPMAALLLVAIFTVHLPYGFSSIKLMSVTSGHAQFGPPGYECDLLYLACLASLVFGGSGPMAIDGFRTSRVTNRTRSPR